MGDLHPTKTRMALLAAVDQDDVIEGFTEVTQGKTYWIPDAVLPVTVVTARIREAERAGWVRLVDPPGVHWVLTGLGEEVLDQHHATARKEGVYSVS